jgi:hypothetical protein
MRIFGVLLVRDEVDVVRMCVLHHLAAGCERIVAVDNGSSDGTATVLRRLAMRTPLSWTVDPSPYRQHELVTGLVHEASAAGADWIIPLDADEFWVAGGGLRDRLAEHLPDAAVRVGRVNFVQRREQRRISPRAVLSMTMRVREPVVGADAPGLVRSGRMSVLEASPSPKLLLRASADVAVARGAHEASALAGGVAETAAISILHAPLRARAGLEQKAAHGRRLEQAGYEGEQGWHVRHWAAQADRGRLDEEWAAHSHTRGELHVGERSVPLAPDDRLRTALSPYVRGRTAQAVARLLRRSY